MNDVLHWDSTIISYDIDCIVPDFLDFTETGLLTLPLLPRSFLHARSFLNTTVVLHVTYLLITTDKPVTAFLCSQAANSRHFPLTN
jgi:hypothetical protein